MLSRLAVATICAAVIVPCAVARDADHLVKGEEELTEQWDRDYMHAVRTILARGWRADVLLRMVDIPAGPPESVVGITRIHSGHQAFEAKASTQLWGALTDTSSMQQRIKSDYRGLHPVLHERSLSQALSARIAALWRCVLADPRNYREETKIYVDPNVFTFDFRFPREHLTARSRSAGARTEQLVLVARALGDYARGASETELAKVVSKAERTIGI